MRCLRWRLGGQARSCGRTTLGIYEIHMAPDSLGNVCRMRQRAHVTGVGNLEVRGVGQGSAEDLDHPPCRRAGAPAADEQRRSTDPGDRIAIIRSRKHEPPLGADLGRCSDDTVAGRIGHLLPGLRPGPVGHKGLGGCRIPPFAKERHVALGQRRDLAPAVRLIRTPQQLKGDRLNQDDNGNPPRKAPRGVQRDRTAVGVPDQMRWSASNIQQSLDSPKLSVRHEHRIARPRRAAPIAQQVRGEETISGLRRFMMRA